MWLSNKYKSNLSSIKASVKEESHGGSSLRDLMGTGWGGGHCETRWALLRKDSVCHQQLVQGWLNFSQNLKSQEDQDPREAWQGQGPRGLC